MIFNNKTPSIVACLALAFFAGCNKESTKITSQPDPQVAYGNYTSFALIRPAITIVKADSGVTPSLIREVRDRAEEALAKKNLKRANSNADLLVLVHGSVEEKIEIEQYGLGYGRFGRGFGSQYSVEQSRHGALMVDVFDSRTRELIWRGIAEADIDGNPNQAMVLAAVDAIVDRYPN